MRFVTPDENGVLLLNTMWLPTWLGVNHAFNTQLEETLQAKIVGREVTEQSLDEINRLVIDAIQEKFSNIPGLWKYLDALKYIED